MRNIDDQLRSAAGSLADNPALAGQVVARGWRHRQRIRAVAACTAVFVAAGGGVSATAMVTTGRHPAGSVSPTVRATTSAPGLTPPATTPPVTVRPAPTPARSTPPGSGAPGDTVTFGIMVVRLPPGWAVLDRATRPAESSPGPGIPAGETMCIGPANTRDSSGWCPGVEFARGGIFGWEAQPFAADQPGGWLSGTGVSACPVNPTDGPDGLNGARPGWPVDPIEKGLRLVGDRLANYDRWSAYCDDGFTFSPQTWYLPLSKYRILDVLSHPETADLLAGITFR